VLALTASRGVSSKWLVNNLDARQRKRFHRLENFQKISPGGVKVLVKEILTPPFVAMPDKAH
jgi:predicted nucleic acid-binding OB-fold protein